MSKKKPMKKWKKRLLTIILVIFILGGSSGLFILYGPWGGFRDWLITTAMTTMTHQYLATWFYDEDVIKNVMDNNKVIETGETTDANAITIGSNKNTTT